MTGIPVVDGRFVVISPVVLGEYASVYIAQAKGTGERVALKLCAPTARARARVLREAALLTRLQLPGISRLVASGELSDGRAWLATSWHDGENLAARTRRAPLDLAAATTLVREVARTLRAVHAMGVVHRDVTPANILLVGGTCEPVLLDFGAAFVPDEPGEGDAGGLVGTPHYMAPEQATGLGQVGSPADVYALGVVLFELVTGRPPFDAESPMALLGRIVLETPPRARDLVRDLSISVDHVISRALAKEPRDRPTAEELAAELTTVPLTSSLPPPATTSTRALAPTVDLPPEGERRIIVVLVAALSDGVAIPAPLAEALASSIGTSATSRRLGDGSFVAIFGGAHSRGDELVLAARAALAARGAHPMLRIALATGLASADEDGPTGEALDRAAAELERARRGDVVIDAATIALLGGRYRVDASDGRTLLVAEADEAFAPPTVLGRRTPFVGRRGELVRALDTYEDAVRSSSPRVLWVVGRAGSGKSRIRTELLQRLAELRHAPTVVTLRGDPATPDQAYGAVGRLFRHLAAAGEARDKEELRASFYARVGACLPARQREAVIPFLAEIAQVHLADQARLQMTRQDPRLMRERVRDAFVAWVHAQASLRPLAVVVEDLQHVDEDSLWLVESAVQHVEKLPWLTLLVGRADAESRLPPLLAGRAIRVSLRRLAKSAASRIARAALPDASPQLVASIAARSGGNPLFVEELVRAASGGLHDEMPTTVHAIVQARLDAFPPDVRSVARAASVFGGAFWEAGIRALVPGVDVPDALARLARDEIVRRRTTSRMHRQKEWTFAVPMVREAAYRMVPPRERQRLHGLAAAWLEGAGATDDATLGRHLERAGELGGAMRRYALAAERALGAGALDAAVRAASHAVEIGAGGDVRARALLARADARLSLGAFEASSQDALAVVDVDDATERQRVCALALAGHARRIQGRYDEALALFDRALARADDGTAARERAQARIWRASALAEHGRTSEALAELSELSDSQALPDDPILRYHLLAAEGYAASLSGDPGRMIAATREAMESARALGDPARLAQALGYYAQALLVVGAYAEAVARAREGAMLAGNVRAASSEALLRFTLARARERIAGPGDALVDAEAALEFAQRAGVLPFLCHVRSFLSIAHTNRGRGGDRDRGLALAKQALDDAPPSGASRNHASLALALAMLAAGDAAAALDALTGLLPGHDSLDLPVALARIEALYALGRDDDADVELAKASHELQQLAAGVADPDVRAGFLTIDEHVRIARLAAEHLRATA